MNPREIRAPRWSSTLPKINEELPVCNAENPVIGIFFIIYGQNMQLYTEEALYAYRQLLRHTNIEKVGKVIFFIDGMEHARTVETRLAKLGIEDAISFLPIGVDEFSRKIALFQHRELRDCKYVLYLDSDMWVASDGYPALDWKYITEKWDESEARTLYGEQIFLSREHLFVQMGITPYLEKMIQPRCATGESVGGYFVGARQGQDVSDLVVDFAKVPLDIKDEVFYRALLHNDASWQVYHTLGTDIPWANLTNYKAFESTFFINVDMQEFRERKHAKQRKELQQIL